MKFALVIAALCLSLIQVAFAETKTVTLAIPKMDCPLCPITVEKALKKVEGVDSVEADLDTKSATVSFDEAITTVQALIDATTNAGFPSEVE